MTEDNKMPVERMLKLRKRVKKNKPSFVRPESWRYFRLKESWRRPKGLDHKIRRKIKGWPQAAGVGYRGPKVARGLHPCGYREVLVHNSEELSKVDPKTQVVRIAHTVGKRNRVRLIAEARKKRIAIVNVKEVKGVPGKEKPVVEEKKEPEKVEEAAKEEKAEEEAKETIAEEKPDEKKRIVKKRKRRTKAE